jgi:hypothetical protein
MLQFALPLLAKAGSAALALGGKAATAAMANPLSTAMGAASIGSSIMGNNAQKDAIAQAEAQRQANMGLIQQYGNRASEALLPGYQAGQNIRQEGMNRNMALAGSTFRPMIETMQSGDMMAQQALIDSIGRMRNARLGDPVGAPIQAQNVPMDYSALSGLINPQPLQFQPIQETQFSDTGMTDWSSADVNKYLEAQKDVKDDYMANRDKLIAGGDPQFATLEGYARWHYDNKGRDEIAKGLRSAVEGVTVPGPTSGMQSPSQGAFTSQQVANIFNMGARG